MRDRQEAHDIVALDYPPFFAYFEKFLSTFALLVDPKIVDLNNLNYDSWTVVAYQRATVILTELVLGTAVLGRVNILLHFPHTDPPFLDLYAAQWNRQFKESYPLPCSSTLVF